MRFSKSYYLPLAVTVLLCGCKSDGSDPKFNAPAALPTASGSGSVTTATATTVAAGSTTLTVPSSTSASLLALSGNAPVTVAFSQNDTSKQPASGLAALGAVASGNVATGTWVINAAKTGPIHVDAPGAAKGDPADGAAVPAQIAASTFTFEISITSSNGSVYQAIASTDGGVTWFAVTITVSGSTAIITGSASGLPLIVMARQIWSTTGV